MSYFFFILYLSAEAKATTGFPGGSSLINGEAPQEAQNCQKAQNLLVLFVTFILPLVV